MIYTTCSVFYSGKITLLRRNDASPGSRPRYLLRFLRYRADFFKETISIDSKPRSQPHPSQLEVRDPDLPCCIWKLLYVKHAKRFFSIKVTKLFNLGLQGDLNRKNCKGTRPVQLRKRSGFMSSSTDSEDSRAAEGGTALTRLMSRRLSASSNRTGSSRTNGQAHEQGSHESGQKDQKAKLIQQEVENLKNKQFSDPIVIKEDDGGGSHLSVSSSPVGDHGAAHLKSKNRPQGAMRTPSSSSDVIRPPHPPANDLLKRLSSGEIPVVPYFGLAEDGSHRKSASPLAKGKKGSSGMPSVADPHSYFGSDHENEWNAEGQGMTSAIGLHGNTSKVVATQHRRRTWDWSLLPKVGSSLLMRTHSFNLIIVPIDGEIKQILYTPSYNKNFKKMNIFLSFNMDTKPKDALVHSRKRLISYGNYITHYLKSRMYAYQCYPFFLQGLSEEDTKTNNYISYNASHDYTEIEALISLWFIQAQRFFYNTNSVFFSSEVIQSLLQRKANTRHQSAVKNSVFVKQGDSDSPKQVVTDQLQEIDILLLRPLTECQLGWQLAYDEPNLVIADYPLDISPWTKNEEDAEGSFGEQASSSSTLRIVTKEEAIELLDSETAGQYFFDCMDRNISELGDEYIASINQKTSSSEQLNSKDAAAENSKKKAAHGKLGKRTGLANLFKRKHTHSIPQNAASEYPDASPPDTKAVQRAHSIQNAWLEDYFGKFLANYRRLGLPTQFFLPQDAKGEKSASSDDEKTAARNAFRYKKETIQIVLPFPENSLPSIYAPKIWSSLCYTKWKSLLREMYRCIVPGGFALGTAYDLRVSNTFSATDGDIDNMQFPTILERDKTYDAISLGAINNGIHIFPTKHLVQAFKEAGFSNIKYSLMSFKTGDLSTEMGCLNELFTQIIWDSLLRREVADPSKPPKDTEPTTLVHRYINEHLDKIDENAGCLRTVLIVAQKPRKFASE